jgi:hypothetical protein
MRCWQAAKGRGDMNAPARIHDVQFRGLRTETQASLPFDAKLEDLVASITVEYLHFIRSPRSNARFSA